MKVKVMRMIMRDKMKVNTMRMKVKVMILTVVD